MSGDARAQPALGREAMDLRRHARRGRPQGARNACFSDLLAFSATQLVREDLPKEEWDKYGIVDEGYRVIVTEKGGLTQGFRFGITDSKEGITYVLRRISPSGRSMSGRREPSTSSARTWNRRLSRILSAHGPPGHHGRQGHRLVHQDGNLGRPHCPARSHPSFPRDMSGFLSAFEDLGGAERVAGGTQAGTQATFLFYEDGAPKPLATVELMSKSTKADAPLLGVGSRLIEVDMQQLRLMDSEMVKLLMAAGGQQERQSPGAAADETEVTGGVASQPQKTSSDSLVGRRSVPRRSGNRQGA